MIFNGLDRSSSILVGGHRGRHHTRSSSPCRDPLSSLLLHAHLSYLIPLSFHASPKRGPRRCYCLGGSSHGRHLGDLSTGALRDCGQTDLEYGCGGKLWRWESQEGSRSWVVRSERPICTFFCFYGCFSAKVHLLPIRRLRTGRSWSVNCTVALRRRTNCTWSGPILINFNFNMSISWQCIYHFWNGRS